MVNCARTMEANDEVIKQILEQVKTIAVVGLSSKAGRMSLAVATYLNANGYRTIPINPHETEVLGERAYPSLAALNEPVDMVQIFRRPEAVPEIVDQALAKGIKIIWMQDGAGHEAAAATARAAGATVVVNDCMMRQHGQLFGAGCG
jgi:predicted CoA-binding protein